MKKKSFILSLFKMKCPRCRTGNMFVQKSSYASFKLSNLLAMQEPCKECNQKYDMEPGFWYGTGYVSYALAVALSVSTFFAYWILIGISRKDSSIFIWLIFNAVILILAQPWLMRMSRVIYLNFFVSYDANNKNNEPTKFDTYD